MNNQSLLSKPTKNHAFAHEVAGFDIPVLFGDARDTRLLENANVTKAKAVLCVTNDDMVNLETALNAREYNSDIKVIIRMFDQKLAKKVQKSLGIHAAYSSSARSGRLFAQAAISENIIDSFEFGGTTINAYQLTVEANSPLVGETIDDVRYKNEVTVLLHEKAAGELDWNPSPSKVLAVGDKLLIMTDRDGINRLQSTKKKLAHKKEHAINKAQSDAQLKSALVYPTGCIRLTKSSVSSRCVSMSER